MKFTKSIPKDINVPREHKNAKLMWLLFKFSIVFALLSAAIYGGFMFYDTHEFRTPIILQNPVPKKELKLNSPVGSQSALIHQVYAEELNDEEYIRMKFGNHGNIAVAVAKAESGLRANAVHQNNNGTIDVGCWQVNSIHLKKDNLTLEILLDCKKATDWVFDNLYLYQGFNPWVAFTSGSYLAKL